MDQSPVVRVNRPLDSVASVSGRGGLVSWLMEPCGYCMFLSAEKMHLMPAHVRVAALADLRTHMRSDAKLSAGLKRSRLRGARAPCAIPLDPLVRYSADLDAFCRPSGVS